MTQDLQYPGIYTIELPFRPQFGGLGIGFTATTVASALFSIPATAGPAFMASNDGSNWYWLAFGVAATLNHLPIPPGTQVHFALPNDGSASTTFSVITRTGSTTGTVSWGLGK
jgi:hypothetical protein